jgi:hypothetical protein
MKGWNLLSIRVNNLSLNSILILICRNRSLNHEYLPLSLIIRLFKKKVFYLLAHTINSAPFEQLIWNSTFSLNTPHLHFLDCKSWFNINTLKNTWWDGKILKVCVLLCWVCLPNCKCIFLSRYILSLIYYCFLCGTYALTHYKIQTKACW